MLTAITRNVSPSIGNCELTHMDRQPIDFPMVQIQHQRYEECLHALGCEIHRLPDAPDLPDSVFVEDTAMVFDEVAIITRPGADSRKPETDSMARALAAFRRLAHIRAPGTIDGGDVLRIGKTVYIGISSRTNVESIDQVREILDPHGYTVTGVGVHGCLHLKTAATLVGRDTVLANRDWIDSRTIRNVEFIDVNREEPFGGNGLLIGEAVIFPENFPKTRKLLEKMGIRVVPVNVSEIIKAEGAVTCCSVVFDA
jgi:dimethylargininase